MPRRLTARAGYVLLSLVLAACASGPRRPGMAQVDAMVNARTAVPVTWVQGSAEDSAAQAYADRTLQGEVPVDSAVRVALLRNKHLQATFEDLGLAQAEVVQAGLFGNPVISGEILNPVSAIGRGRQMFGVALPFLDFLQAPMRRRVAASRFAAERARVAAAVLQLVADVRTAYVNVQATEQMEELRETVLRATLASAGAAQALRDAGNLSEYDLLLEQGLAADARLALYTAQAERRAARAELARVMGAGLAGDWKVTPRLELPRDGLFPPPDLAQVARARRLDLRAAYLEVEAAGRLVGFSRGFALLPDGTIGYGQDREPDGTFRGVTGSLEVPLVDRGQARIARAQALFRQARNRHDALAVDVTAEVQALTARLETARARAEHLQANVIPLRQRVVEQSQRFVNAMQQTVFTLLVAKQAEIDAGQQYVEALRDYWVTRAQLERAAGGSFAPLTAAERAGGQSF